MKGRYLSVLSLLALTLQAGCDRYTLIEFGSGKDGWLPDELQWRVEKDLRSPRTMTEELAVKVAADRQPVKNGKQEVLHLADISGDQRDTIVAVIEELDDDGNRADKTFLPKKVERYVIRSGRISASMGPSIEPFPDARLEKSINVAARDSYTQGGFAVIMTSGSAEPIGIRAISCGCKVEITCYRTGVGGPGAELFTKTVNYCKPQEVRRTALAR